MADYNKRLGKILKSLAHKAYLTAHAPGHTKLDGRTYRAAVDEAKQAYTSLIKKLVAEAKPSYKPISKYAASIYNQGFNQAVDEFEQNILKQLEEV